MRFTSMPEAMSSFRQRLLYAFDTESTTPKDVEIKIINRLNNTIIGRKLLRSVTSGEVDIAPYLRSAVVASLPQQVDECAIIDTSTQIAVSVEINGTSSPTLPFVAAKVDLTKSYTPLTTQQLHRTMAHDEFDIVSLFALHDTSLEVVVELIGSGGDTLRFTPPSGQSAIAITARNHSNVDAIRVTINVNGAATTVISYELKPNLRGARRLAWLNDNMGVECYTFPLRKSVLVEATRRHMESIWGKEAAALERQNELKLISAYEPQEQIEALSAILSSPRVWLVKGNELQPTELTTERILTAPCDKMGIIEVDIRAAREGELLW
jgi:hypothetical protein